MWQCQVVGGDRSRCLSLGGCVWGRVKAGVVRRIEGERDWSICSRGLKSAEGRTDMRPTVEAALGAFFFDPDELPR